MISHQLALEIICKDIPYVRGVSASIGSKHTSWTIGHTYMLACAANKHERLQQGCEQSSYAYTSAVPCISFAGLLSDM